MTDSLSFPIVLVPGLLASPRLYAEQIPELWRLGPVTIASHTRDDSMGAIALIPNNERGTVPQAPSRS